MNLRAAYTTLGVPEGSTLKAVAKKYRNLLRQFLAEDTTDGQPFQSSKAARRWFAALQDAYDVLEGEITERIRGARDTLERERAAISKSLETIGTALSAIPEKDRRSACEWFQSIELALQGNAIRGGLDVTLAQLDASLVDPDWLDAEEKLEAKVRAAINELHRREMSTLSSGLAGFFSDSDGEDYYNREEFMNRRKLEKTRTSPRAHAVGTDAGAAANPVKDSCEQTLTANSYDTAAVQLCFSRQGVLFTLSDDDEGEVRDGAQAEVNQLPACQPIEDPGGPISVISALQQSEDGQLVYEGNCVETGVIQAALDRNPAIGKFVLKSDQGSCFTILDAKAFAGALRNEQGWYWSWELRSAADVAGRIAQLIEDYSTKHAAPVQ